MVRPVRLSTIFRADNICREVVRERIAQEMKFPDQHLPDGTSTDWEEMLDILEDERRYNATPDLTWASVLLEEVAEALTEEAPAKLRAELIQVAAVAVRWIEDIDRRV